MLAFGKSSRQRKETCHKDLQLILDHALAKGIIDFSVVCGHRSEEEQNKLYPTYTKVKFPNSKHNSYPSNAVDIWPYVPHYGALSGHVSQLEKIAKEQYSKYPLKESLIYAEAFVKFQYGVLLGVIQSSAKELGIAIRVGYDWDGDRDTFDHSFLDFPHIELL